MSGDSNDVIERPRQVAQSLGVSLSTLWRRVKKDPSFPQPVDLGPNSVGFLRSERLAYMRRLAAERDAELACERGNESFDDAS